MLSRFHLSLLAWMAMVFLPISAGAIMPQKSNVITIAGDIWCPVSCDPQHGPPGLGAELAKAVFEPLGYTVNYTVMPWEEALQAVKTGKIDAIVGANLTDDSTLLCPATPIYPVSDDFFVSAKSDYDSVDMQLIRKRWLRMGVIKGYGYDAAISAYITDNREIEGKVQEASGTDPLAQNIQKLLDRKIDVLVESKLVMDYTLRKLQLDEKIIWAGGIDQGNIYLAFSPALKTSPDHQKEYDQGIAKLKAAGTLKIIYAHYGLGNYYGAQ